MDRMRDGVAVLQKGIAEDLRGSLQSLHERVESREGVAQQLSAMIADVDGQLRNELVMNRRSAQVRVWGCVP